MKPLHIKALSMAMGLIMAFSAMPALSATKGESAKKQVSYGKRLKASDLEGYTVGDFVNQDGSFNSKTDPKAKATPK